MNTRFLRENARWLSVGLILTTASSFGQTYFISVFADRFMETYDLSDGDWGTIYLVATLGSALALTWVGRLADTLKVGQLAAFVIAGYAVVALGVALNPSAWTLVILVFGLRFCGQGMMSHLGITAMARWFRANRGRAIAVAGLGFSIGQATLPRIAAELEPLIGWRMVWVGVSVLLLLVFLPAVTWLARHERSPQSDDGGMHSPGRDGTHWTRSQVLGHWLFWVMVPGVVAASFIGTVIFFQFAHIGQTMGWSKADMTLAFPCYAIATVVFALISGPLADRFGPDRLVPLYLLPMGVGMLFIGPFEGIWAWWIALILTGVTSGISQVLFGAIWAELFGTRHLGSVKALASAFMVVGSAIGPGLTGVLIDFGYDYTDQAPWMFAATVLLSGLHGWVLLRIRRDLFKRAPG